MGKSSKTAAAAPAVAAKANADAKAIKKSEEKGKKVESAPVKVSRRVRTSSHLCHPAFTDGESHDSSPRLTCSCGRPEDDRS